MPAVMPAGGMGLNPVSLSLRPTITDMKGAARNETLRNTKAGNRKTDFAKI